MSKAAEWYCSKGNERVGPMTLDDLQRRVAAGQVGPADLVWTQGMPQWVPASQVPAVFGGTPRAAAAAVPASPVPVGVTQSQPSQVGYYAGNVEMPQRAAATLRGHAVPRGDTGSWPLDDLHVGQLEKAIAIRRKISSAAGLYRGLFALSLIGVVLVLIGTFATVATGPRGIGMVSSSLIVSAIIVVAQSTFLRFAWWATVRSHRWASITAFILFMLGILGCISTIVTTNAPGVTGVFTVVIILYALFAFIALRAFLVIPSYLMQPAWCQEIIAKAKL